MPSYAERIQVERPACWGSVQAYDSKDDECESCRYQHTCRAEVQRQDGHSFVPTRRVVTSTSNTPYRSGYRRDEEVEKVDWEPGRAVEGENMIARFFKDAAAGSLRGGFFEMYRFWRVFRFK